MRPACDSVLLLMYFFMRILHSHSLFRNLTHHLPQSFAHKRSLCDFCANHASNAETAGIQTLVRSGRLRSKGRYFGRSINTRSLNKRCPGSEPPTLVKRM